MAEGIAVAPDRIIAALRRQLDVASFEAAQWQAAAEGLKAENEAMQSELADLKVAAAKNRKPAG